MTELNVCRLQLGQPLVHSVCLRSCQMRIHMLNVLYVSVLCGAI